MCHVTSVKRWLRLCSRSEQKKRRRTATKPTAMRQSAVHTGDKNAEPHRPVIIPINWISYAGARQPGTRARRKEFSESLIRWWSCASCRVETLMANNNCHSLISHLAMCLSALSLSNSRESFVFVSQMISVINPCRAARNIHGYWMQTTVVAVISLLVAAYFGVFIANRLPSAFPFLLHNNSLILSCAMVDNFSCVASLSWKVPAKTILWFVFVFAGLRLWSCRGGGAVARSLQERSV